MDALNQEPRRIDQDLLLEQLLDSLQISLVRAMTQKTGQSPARTDEQDSSAQLYADSSLMDSYQTAISSLVDNPERAGHPFSRICHSFELNTLERMILLLSISLYFRPELAPFYTFFNKNEHSNPSLPVLDALFLDDPNGKASIRMALHPDSPLLSFALIKDPFQSTHTGAPLPLVARKSVLHYLSSGKSRPASSSLYEIHSARDQGVSEHNEELLLQEGCKRDFDSILLQRSKLRATLVHMNARDASDALLLTAVFARRNHTPLLVLNPDQILVSVSEKKQSESVREIARECRLHEAFLFLDDSQVAESRRTELHRFLRQLLKLLHTPLFLVSGTETPTPSFSAAEEFRIPIPEPDLQERRALWNALSRQSHEQREFEIRWKLHSPDSFASRFRFGRAQILDVYRTARSRALLRHTRESVITEEDLLLACSDRSGHRLHSLARRVETKFGWEDLILPGEQKEILREITLQEKHRELVYGNWGFDTKGYARGLHLLFFGKSGTGKTMAAAVLARELDRDLFRVDLSLVVSKYIGETEKNLSRIFAEGEKSHAILFFDEADSLFGKRSEVKDAKDRYANMEVSYLLQKMEEYPGITILASNLAENMDPAFTRRIHFFLEFPVPEGEMALALWKGSFPGQMPLDKDMDFDFLAKRVRLSGGEIRSVALNAAFYGAEEDSAVAMRHIMRAIRAQYKKTNRVYNEGDLKPYYHLGFTPLPGEREALSPGSGSL